MFLFEFNLHKTTHDRFSLLGFGTTDMVMPHPTGQHALLVGSGNNRCGVLVTDVGKDDNSIGQVVKCVATVALTKRNIHENVMVGGSNHIPEVQQFIHEFSNAKEPRRCINSVSVPSALFLRPPRN